MSDYLPYKNVDFNCDVTQSFDPNFDAPDLFMRPRRDSIECLFEKVSETNGYDAKSSADHKST